MQEFLGGQKSSFFPQGCPGQGNEPMIFLFFSLLYRRATTLSRSSSKDTLTRYRSCSTFVQAMKQGCQMVCFKPKIPNLGKF
jgi:hypothetical protein